MATPRRGAAAVSAHRRRDGWDRGLIGVPGWVASALVLAALLAIVLTLLALIPPAQRPRLEPPAPTGGTTSVAP